MDPEISAAMHKVMRHGLLEKFLFSTIQELDDKSLRKFTDACVHAQRRRIELFFLPDQREGEKVPLKDIPNDVVKGWLEGSKKSPWSSANDRQMRIFTEELNFRFQMGTYNGPPEGIIMDSLPPPDPRRPHEAEIERLRERHGRAPVARIPARNLGLDGERIV